MAETVSDSEVGQKTRCGVAHLYGYGMELSPLKQNDHLQIGNAFHEMAAEYYQSLKDEIGFDYAIDLAKAKGFEALQKNKYHHDNIDLAYDMFDRYTEETDSFEWEILSVEEYFEYQLSDEIVFNGAIDLLVRVRRAPKEILEKFPEIIGKLAVVDHKTCYNFWTKNEYRMQNQLPKYIFALNRTRESKEKIEYGIFNLVRTRADAKEIVFRKVVQPSEIRQVNVIAEHLKVAEQIVELRKTPIDQWMGKAWRTNNKDICKYCDWIEPCDMELDGRSRRDIQTEIEIYFKEKDMRYREERKAAQLLKNQAV